MRSGRNSHAPTASLSERSLVTALRNGSISYRQVTASEQSEARLAARNTLKRDKRMNIRVSSMDMLSLQIKAAKLGMPYQTLVSSVLHQYLTGRLKQSDV